jgi:Uma2 family endonuclease
MNAPAVRSEVGEEVLERKRFTGAEWDRMVALGLFDEDQRLELIDGEVVVMSPIGDLHAAVHSLLSELLRRALPKDHHVREEKPLDLGQSRLYPDIAVVLGTPDRYLRRSPAATDSPLVVEVADTTLARDLVVKAQVYARAGIREYWVVVIPEQVVVVHRKPRRLKGKAVYAEVERLSAGAVQAAPLRRAIKLSAFLRGP